MGKRSIDFTKERTAKIEAIIDLMGIKGVHGEIPKAIDFCVTMTLEALRLCALITPRLESPEREYFLKAVDRLQRDQAAYESYLRGELWDNSNPHPSGESPRK